MSCRVPVPRTSTLALVDTEVIVRSQEKHTDRQKRNWRAGGEFSPGADTLNGSCDHKFVPDTDTQEAGSWKRTGEAIRDSTEVGGHQGPSRQSIASTSSARKKIHPVRGGTATQTVVDKPCPSYHHDKTGRRWMPIPIADRTKLWREHIECRAAHHSDGLTGAKALRPATRALRHARNAVVPIRARCDLL